MDNYASPPNEPLDSEEALRRCIECLVGDEPPQAPELWVLLLDADSRPLRAVTVIDDVPPRPEHHLIESLFAVVDGVLADVPGGGSVTFALHRGGGSTVTPLDRTWAVTLQQVGATVDVAQRGTYLATAGSVRRLRPDESDIAVAETPEVAGEAESYVADMHGALTTPRERECLVCYLLRMVGEFGCDGTHRWTKRWRDLCAPRATALVRRMASKGGRCCDCEVLSNVYPDRIPEDFRETPPACAGVSRRGSTLPCRRPAL